jgi:hypothetical protein
MLQYAWLAVSLMSLRQVPVGTQLHVRLATPIGSFGSRPGAPLSAVLIAPVTVDGQTVLPEGSILSGMVTRAQAVGFGIAHETAALSVDFDTCTLPGGLKIPMATRLLEVDNGREHVIANGSINGVRATSSISYRFTGYIRFVLAWEWHARLALWVAKMILLQVPEPEIYYPAGVELTLGLRDTLVSEVQPHSDERLTGEERTELRAVTATMPYRAYVAGSNRASDLMNVLFAGSKEEIEAAFLAAGWTRASVSTMHTTLVGVRAVAEGHGDRHAPMSRLLANDREPDMLWEKGLNDFSKRHHVRIWQQDSTWNGQALWIGAATRDVDFAFLRRGGGAMTHKIAQDIDQERDKIAHDFEFTACIDVVDWWDRPGAPTTARNGTGDLMETDGRLAVLRLNRCSSPRVVDDADAEPLRTRPNAFKRMLRREILSARSDFYRSTVYWRAYEGTRWAVMAMLHRHRPPQEPRTTETPGDPGTTDSGFFARARNSSWFR